MSGYLGLEVRQFAQGHNVIVEGKSDQEEFFIVRSGRVDIYSETNVAYGEDVSVQGPGSYFGLVSSMTGHARTETADARADCSLIVVRRDQFEGLAVSHPDVVRRIIFSLSKQLRKFDDEIGRRTHGSSEHNNGKDVVVSERLYDVGKYYLEKKHYYHALYALSRYIEVGKENEKVEDAKEHLKSMSSVAQRAMNVQNEGDSMIRTYQADTFLFCEHEPGAEAFIIQEGEVRIVRIEQDREVQLAMVSPPAVIGEMAILENKPRSASAIAAGDVRAMVISRDSFNTMISTQPVMTRRIMETLCDRIWVAYRQLANLLIVDEVGRLWDRILIEIEKAKAPVEAKQNFPLNFGPSDLLQMCGIKSQEGRNYIRSMLEDTKVIGLKDGNRLFVYSTEGVMKHVSFYKKVHDPSRRGRKR